jgi:hypothetical protein
MKRLITSTYDVGMVAVEAELRSATTKIDLSFDLWTSPGRRLSLLGVVAYYLNRDFEPRAVLLVMPRMQGSYTAINLASQISRLIQHYELETSFGYVVTDNTSENRASMNLLATELAFNASTRYVLCVGHVINLVAHKVLFGSDVESFEHELEATATAEQTWAQ